MQNTMSILHHISVSGLWGSHQIDLHLHENVNFLIGINGTGKTTLMNLVGAVLTCNYEMLTQISFNEITIQLKKENEKSQIRVVYNELENTKYERVQAELAYYVRSNETEPETEYLINRINRNTSRKIYSQQDLEQQLNSLINVVWLTIHRIHPYMMTEEPYQRRISVPLIDIKLKNLSIRLARHFSALESQARTENNVFQRNILLGLVGEEWKSDKENKNKQTLSQTRELAENVFKETGVNETDYQVGLDKLFERYEAINSNELTTKELASLVIMRRLERVMQDWQSKRSKHKEIFARRDRFLTILNSLCKGKTFKIAETNELVVENISNSQIPLSKLSSGEKQLLILLGEPLLQGDHRWLYIIDEPELSLHIQWQAKLVSGIKDLSPQIQIFFATHSPDIVSSYSDKIHDMQKVLS